MVLFYILLTFEIYISVWGVAGCGGVFVSGIYASVMLLRVFESLVSGAG